MLRFTLPVVVVIGLIAEPAAAVEVTKEVAAIQSAFSDTIKQLSTTPPAERQAAYSQAMETRKAALEKLAAAAEEAKSTEHGALARLYLQINQPAGALRHAQALVAGGANDAASHLLLIQAHSLSGDTTAAVAAVGSLFQLAWDEKTAAEYLASTVQAVSTVSRVLTADEKFEAAEKLQSDWQTKLESFKPEADPLKQQVQNALRMLQSMRQQAAAAKARAALVGTQYTPLDDPTWLNGTPLSPGELRGKVVLLDFWAVWCGPCIATFPHLIEWHEKYADKGLVIIGVTKRYGFDWDAEAKRAKSVGELEPAKEDAATTEFAKHYGLKHRLAVTVDNSASQKYGVTGIPQAVLVDQGGVIRMIKVGSGEKNAADLESEIRKLLGLDAAATTK